MCKREKGLIHNGSEIKLAHFLASFAYECDIKFDIWPVARGSFLIFKHAHTGTSAMQKRPLGKRFNGLRGPVCMP